MAAARHADDVVDLRSPSISTMQTRQLPSGR